MRQLVFLNCAEIWRLAARVCALTHWGQTCSCTCMFFFFFLFLGYRGGLFSGPQSLPIPRQVHMCFISRQACLLNCKFQRRCWPGDTLGPEVEAERRKQKTGTEGITSLCFLFFFLRLSPKKNSGFFFLFLDPLPHPPHPPFLRCSSLGTCVSLRPPFFPQNWFIPRPTLHPRAAAHANSFGLFFFFMSLSVCFPHHLWSSFFFCSHQSPSPYHTPTLFSLSSDSVCAGCPGFVPVYVPALRYCVCRREERGGEKKNPQQQTLRKTRALP